MTFTKAVLVLVCLMSTTLVAQEAEVTPLMSKDLTECPGKESVMITVEYPPGHSDQVHRHNAYAFVYVREGSVVMQVRGGKEVTLTPGQTSEKQNVTRQGTQNAEAYEWYLKGL